MKDVSGKVALITGGGCGIGRLMALKLAKRGARIVLWDINQTNLDTVLAELRGAGHEAHGYNVDVGDRARVYAAGNQVRADVGDVDLLINNAGIVSGKPLLDLPDERIEATFRVNTLALFWCTKAFLGPMVQRNAGHVVTIASAAGLVGTANMTDYSASKFAAVGFNESLRNELKKMGTAVKTTVVCPYYIDTGMFDGVKTKVPAILPIMKEDDVAERIVNAILKDKPKLILPPFINVVPVARMLPVSLFDATNTFLGVNSCMDDFVGREGRK